ALIGISELAKLALLRFGEHEREGGAGATIGLGGVGRRRAKHQVHDLGCAAVMAMPGDDIVIDVDEVAGRLTAVGAIALEVGLADDETDAVLAQDILRGKPPQHGRLPAIEGLYLRYKPDRGGSGPAPSPSSPGGPRSRLGPPWRRPRRVRGRGRR